MVEKNNVRHICIIGCVRICSATTPHPSSSEEGTTLGARPCSGRHGGLPLRLDADYAGCCLPLAGVSFRFASLPLRRQRSSGSPHQARMAIGPSSKGLLPLRRQRSSGSPHQARMAIGPSSKGLLHLRRQRSSGSPHQARMAIGPSSKGLLHHLPVFWSGLRPSLHPSFFFNFRNFGCRLIEKSS